MPIVPGSTLDRKNGMRLFGMFVAAAVSLSALLVQGTAHGCRCVEPTIQQAYRRADLVVAVTIDEVGSSGNDAVRARATVREAWKSLAPASITFVSGEDCIYDVKVPQKHLLFLYRGDDGTFGTIRCRGNLPFANAKSSLAWLKRHGKRAPISKS